MGNTTSTQRADFLQRDDRRFRELVQVRSNRSRSRGERAGYDRGQAQERSLPRRPLSTSNRRDSNIYGTFRRQVSAQSVTVETDAGQSLGTDGVVFEQEERPLVNMEDLGMRDAPITHIAATPLARRNSTMSRLGSRILPNSVVRGLLSSGEETPAEGRALRVGISGARVVRPATERRPSNQISNRFSLRHSWRSRNSAASVSRRQAIRGPFPLQNVRNELMSNERANEQTLELVNSAPTPAVGRESNSWLRRDRLNRVRNSLSLPLHSFFGPSTERSGSNQNQTASSERPSGVPFTEDSDHLLPPISTMDHRMDFEDAPHELDALEPETRNVLSSTRTGHAPSAIRRLPHALRSRSTRVVRRGEQPPLSQVLQLAAAAIAAQLSGHANPLISSARPLGSEGFDGSIQNFVQTLQDAATAQVGDNLDGSTSDGHLPPVNFLRVFQFPNDNSMPGLEQERSATAESMDVDDLPEELNTERTVTLVLVGVRSMPTNGESAGDDNGDFGPSLDTLLSLPFLPPTNVLRNDSASALLRRSEGRSRLSSRRNSMTNFSSFPAQYESQRHQRTRNSAVRSPPEQTPLASNSNLPGTMSESPPGPHPPPSTPADPRSGAATPSRRPSSASAVHSPMLPHLLESPSPLPEAEMMDSSFSAARQRRRSDSEFARRPELSSGASRRNGVVEPDNPAVATGRSWLIYVVGTNVSPDHPAFTMPSLFTDNPSYEDMQLLSNLLGPVKPPVATQEDVISAGGIYRLVERGGALFAEAPAGSDLQSMAILGGDRCLICLCDYEPCEEIRQLNKCQHVYHRECIDEWLTTGRNSCPMCRGPGVDEGSSTPPRVVS